jgi:hypothetical protein
MIFRVPRLPLSEAASLVISSAGMLATRSITSQPRA